MENLALALPKLQKSSSSLPASVCSHHATSVCTPLVLMTVYPGEGLRHVGDALQKINDAQLAMDDEVYLNVLGPLRDLQEHQIKLIAKEKKKMEGRRLDYDFKV